MATRDARGVGLTILVFVLLGVGVVPASAQTTTLIDTYTSATNFANTASTPRTYMGDAFTNNNLPAGTTGFQITGGTVYAYAATAATYTDIQARIQLWNTVTPSSTTAVFSNPLPLITVDFGGGSTTASKYYGLSFNVSSLVALTGGSGTNWGITINFQTSTSASPTLADNNNFVPALTYNTNSTGYAAGTITTGTSPTFGYYRNAEGQTDFTFVSGDARSLSTTGAYDQGLAFILSGTAVPEPSTWLCPAVLVLITGGVCVRRWRSAVA